MKRNRIIFVIILLTFLILSVFAFFIHIKQSEYIDLKQERSFSIIQQVVDGKIIFFRKLISKRLSNEIQSNKQLKKYILENQAKKRDLEFFDIYKILKKENRYIRTLNFISPKNEFITQIPSYKNINNNKIYRDIVIETNKIKRAKYGFEFGDVGLLYRLVLPLFYDNKYYGVIELGIDPMLFVSDMITIEKYLNATVLAKVDMINNHLKDYEIFKNIVLKSDKYILFDDKPLFKYIIESKAVDKNKPVIFEKEYYQLFTYNLLNFDGKVEGVILVSSYLTDDKIWQDGLNVSMVLILAIVLLLFFVVVYFGFNYYDKKINELVEHEKQNERLLFQQSKMASMGEMIGNIAHQWRQPLSTITSAASGMSIQKDFGVLTDDQFTKFIDTIMKQANYMSKTIDDFRGFFKTDKEKIKFNVREAIEKDIKLLEASLKNHSITVDININSELELMGHQNEFTQVMLNIINNAKDQLIKNDQEVKLIKINGKITNQKIKIIVTDNGGGIEENIIDKIFEPYFTTKHQSQGTGIGLFMTSEIISKHFLGNIEVKNKELSYKKMSYKGACFIITIPLDKEEF